MSKPISVTIPHQLGVAEAKRRIAQGVVQFQGQSAGLGLARMNSEWLGDEMTFHARIAGQALSGRLAVLSDSVNLEVELPAMLSALANAIRGRLKKQGSLLLDKK
jgi:hypothetical protein